MKSRIIFFFIAICFLQLTASAQCPSNFTFSNNNLSNWTSYLQLYNGATKANTFVTTLNPPPAGVVAYNSVLEQGSNLVNAVQLIPYTGSNMAKDSIVNALSMVPNINGYQYNYAVKLGNSITKQKVRKLAYYIHVPAGVTNYNITYAYALMLEDPGHTWDQQPRFTATVRNPALAPGQDTIKCASVSYFVPAAAADKTSQGFILGNAANGIYYKNWTEVSVNLGVYAGETIILEFESDDCSLGGHFGYAYFAMRNDGCGSGSISGNSIVCSNGSVDTYTTPYVSGASYAWTIPSGWTGSSTTNSINVTPNGNSGVITVTPSKSCGNISTGSLQVTATSSVPVAPGIITGPTSVCSGSKQLTYSIAPVSNAMSYTWTIPAGWSIVLGADSTTIVLNAAATGTGGTISVVANNGCGASTATSTSVLFTTGTASNGGTSTGGLSVCSGTNVTLTSTGYTGTILNWQSSIDGGVTWINISNSASATYTVTKPTVSALYRMMVQSSPCNIGFSTPTAVTINALPVISFQPSSVGICASGNTSFSVVATGSGLTYQWQVSTNSGTSYTNIANSGIYSNATTATLNLTAATSAYNSYLYRCVLTGSCGSINSNAATLTVSSTSTTPSISSQPVGATICSGSNITLSEIATGINLSYQWYNNGSNSANSGGTAITGATSSSYAFYPGTTAYYYCKITSTCGTSASSFTDAVQIAVTTPTAVSANIVASPSTYLCPNTSTNVTFTASATGGSSPSYVWTKNNISVGNLTNTYSDASLVDKDVIAVSVTTTGSCLTNNPANAAVTMSVAPPAITGTTNICIGATATLNGAGIAAEANPWMSADQSIATVNASGVVTGVSAGTTSIIYTTNTGCTNSVTVTVKALPTVAAITGINAACIGNTTTLYNATVGGSWSSSDLSIATINSSTGIVTGVSNGTVTITYTTAADITSGCSNNTSRIVTIIPPASITAQPSTSIQSVCLNSSATALSVSSGTGNTYQWYSNASASNSGGTLLIGATDVNYTPQTSSVGTLYYYCVVTNGSGCSINSNVSGAVNVVLSQISFTVKPLAATCLGNSVTYTTQTGATNYVWTLNPNSGYTINSGGIGTSSNTVTLTWGSTGQKIVTVSYTNSGGCGGADVTAAADTITVNAIPAITGQPATATQTICQNGTATDLSITASGTGLIYQWFSNTSNSNSGGTYIDGARSNSYTPATATAGSLYYYCIVTNGSGCSVTSNVSGLITVNAKPNITAQPTTTPQYLCQGTAGTSISVTATGSGITYQWYRNTSATNSGGTLVSSATTSSYTPPTSLTAGTYYYYCVITSGSCFANSNVSGVVSINTNSAPTITVQPAGYTACSNNNTIGLSVVANAGGINGGGITYRWYSNTSSSTSGRTSITSSPTASPIYIPTSNSKPYYWVRVYNNACTGTNSSGAAYSTPAAFVTINTAPTISAQPTTSTQTLCQNASATSLSVTATSGSTYQWYVNTSSNNTGGTSISGATSATYSPTTFSPGTYYYYCVASLNGCSTTSNVSGAVTVNPSVSMQIGAITSVSTTATSFTIPYNSTTGDHYTLSAGSPALSSFTPVSSTVIPASPITINLPSGTKTANSYNFSLGVTNTSSGCSSSYTIPLVISSLSPGTIGSDQNICVNPTISSIGLTSTASATSGTSYQWQSSTSIYSGYTNISGATSSTYTVPSGLTRTTYYRRAASLSGSTTVYTDPITIKVGVPTIITLTSGTISPTLCQSTPLSNIVFSISGDVTGATLTGSLPTGVIGTYDGTTGLYTISGTPTQSGTFSYTINTTGACTNASTSGTITVNALSAVSFSASPSTNNCIGSIVTYTTQSGSGQSNYLWILPGIAGVDYTITSGGIGTSSNTVSLKYLTSGNKTVSINYANSNGCSAVSATTNTTTINLPVPSFVSAPANTCVNNTSVYTTQNSKSNYIWTIPGVVGTDYNIVVGGVGLTNYTVSLQWLTSGTKNVEAYYTDANGCLAPTSASNSISVSSLPTAAFTAPPTTACVGANVVYTTLSGQTGYVWSVPGTLNTDYQIISGSLSSASATVTLRWLTTGSKNVSVNYSNSNGCSSASPASVTTVVSQTIASFSAAPSANSCLNSSVTYTAQSGSGYTWVVPGTSGTDYSIISGGIGSSDNTVTLQWKTTGTKNVTVNYTANGCTAASPASASTTITVPTVIFSVQPSGSICGGTNAVYTIQSGHSNYLWSLPGLLNIDYTIVSGGSNTDNTVTIQWLTAGSKSVSVSYTDANGCSTANTASSAVIVTVPDPSFISPISSTCVGSPITFTTQSGNSNYVWSIPGTTGIDYTVTSGGSSTDNSITLQWLTSGNPSVGVYYSANGCTAANSAISSVAVNPIPTITLGYIAQVSTTATSFLIPYTTTTGFPDQYTVTVGTPALGGFTTISNAALGSSPINISIPASSANTYQFNFGIANSITGCSASYTIPLVITNINPGTISSDQTICSGTAPSTLTNSLSASYYTSGSGVITYQWQSSTSSINAGYADITGATNSAYSPGSLTQTTYYRRTATDGSSVAYSTPVTINVNSLSVPLLSSSSFQNICAGTNVTYATDAGQTNYIWTQSGSAGTDYDIVSGGTGTDNAIVIKWKSSGTQTVSINYTDQNGCSAASASSTNTTVNTIPVPALNVSNSGAVCVGSSAIITYTTDANNTFYTWNMPGSISGTDYLITGGGVGASNTSVTLEWLTSGSKTITINYTDANGCVALNPTTVHTTVSSPVPSLSPSVTGAICAGTNITYTTDAAKSLYVWTLPGILNTDYSIVSGGSGTDNSVVVQWLTAGSKTVGVNYTDAGCTAANASTISTIVFAMPTITLGSYASSVSLGITSFVIPYTAISQSPNQYSVTGLAWSGFTIISNTSLPTSPITVTIPNSSEGTYTMNLTVRNSTTGCSSPNYPVIVVVSNVDPGTIGSDQTICSDATPAGITNTAPASITTNYSWQSSTTSVNSGFTNISGQTGATYAPGALIQTTYFRRGASNGTTTAYSPAITVHVNTNPSVSLYSVSADEIICKNTQLTNIIYSIGSATSALATGLPTGLTGAYNSYTGLFTISGIPTGSTATYTVTATSGTGCGTASAGGTITVNPLNTISRTSASGTDAQTVCLNTSIANITYSTTSATGATVTGLPTGVTASWSSNTVTISGTPSASGTYNYTVTLTGGCGTIIAIGTITVNEQPLIILTPDNVNGSICANTFITYSSEFNQSNYSWQYSGVANTDYIINAGGAVTDNSTTVEWKTPGTKTVSVNYTDANGCSAATATIVSKTINALPVPSFITAPGSNVCQNSDATYSTQSGQTNYTWSVSGTLNSDYSIVSGGIGSSSNTVTVNWLIGGPQSVSVYYTDANGCTASAPIVNATTISGALTQHTLTGGGAYCTGGVGVDIQLNGSDAGVDYQLMNGPTQVGTFIGGTGSALDFGIQAYSAGSYSVLATDNTLGCSGTLSSTLTVTVNALPTTLILTGSTVCSGTIATITSSTSVSGVNYQLYTSSNATVGSAIAGTGSALTWSSVAAGNGYYVIGTNSSSCTSSSNTVNVVVNALPTAPTVSLTQPTCSNANGSVAITSGTSGLTFSTDGINYASYSSAYSVAASASYSITAKNSSGCISTVTTGTMGSQPATPTAPTVSLTQPTCSNANGSVAITSSTSGLTFSTDGTNYASYSSAYSVAALASYSITSKNSAGCISTATTGTMGSQPATPIAPTVSLTQSTCSVATGTISITAPTGVGITYSIGGSIYQSSTTFSNVTSGTYSVTVQNNGCVSTATSATINVQPATPVAAINTPSSTILTCNTTSISLTATGGTTYSWSDGTSVVGSSATLSVTSAGTYTVTVTNSNGCSATASQSITQDASVPSASINTPSSTILTCNTTSIGLTATGGTTYSWSDGTSVVGSSATLSVTIPGTYTVTVTNANGCSATANKVITQNISLPTITATTNQSVCAGASVTLKGSGATSYVWNNGIIDNISFVPTQTTTYTVTGTDANGCTNTATTTVTVNTIPTITISPASASIANGSSVHLTASGATNYSWLPTAGLSSTNLAVIDASPSVFTTYIVTGTDANGCSSTASILISVDATPASVTINAPATTELTCNTQTISLTATGTGSFSWSDGTNVIGTNAILQVTTPGIYTVTVTNSNGNTATASLPITQNITQPNTAITLPASIELSATNSSIKLIAVGKGAYSWTDGVSTLGTIDTLIVTTTGRYSVTITGINGCSATSDFITIKPVAPTAIPATFIVHAISNPSDVSHQVIVLSGARVAYYSNPAGGTEIPVPTLPVIPGVYIYYVSQIINNIQSAIVPLTVTILPPVKVADIEMTVNRIPLLQSDGSYILSFSIQLNNLTNNSLDSMMVSDDLTKVFSSAMPYQIVDLKASGALFVNRLFDGNVNQDLLLPESKLAGNGTDSIILSVKFFPNGFVGQLKNISILTTKSAYGTFSMASNDPTINANINNRVPTLFKIPLVDIMIPSGFSPNRDGINDYFVITRPFNTSVQLEVFNQWGNLVYKAQDYKNSWDGRGNQPGNILGEELTDGTYYYVVHAINNTDGLVRRFAGYITLKR